MKIKDNFVLQEIADEFIVVPVGKDADVMNGVIKLNYTGVYLWKLLSDKKCSVDELYTQFAKEFSLDQTTARSDIDSFLSEIRSFGCIEE